MGRYPCSGHRRWDNIDIAGLTVAREYGLTFRTLAPIFGVTRSAIASRVRVRVRGVPDHRTLAWHAQRSARLNGASPP